MIQKQDVGEDLDSLDRCTGVISRDALQVIVLVLK
jgi:hypothetical protein